MSLCDSVALCLCLCPCLTLFVSLCGSLWLSVSAPVSLCLCQFVALCGSLSLSLVLPWRSRLRHEHSCTSRHAANLMHSYSQSDALMQVSSVDTRALRGVSGQHVRPGSCFKCSVSSGSYWRGTIGGGHCFLCLYCLHSTACTLLPALLLSTLYALLSSVPTVHSALPSTVCNVLRLHTEGVRSSSNIHTLLQHDLSLDNLDCYEHTHTSTDSRQQNNRKRPAAIRGRRHGQ